MPAESDYDVNMSTRILRYSATDSPLSQREHQFPSMIAKNLMEWHYRLMDTCVFLILASTAAATAGLSSPEATVERIIFLMPLLGAIITAGSCFLLNPHRETRDIVAGRCLIALLVSGVGPSALAAFLSYKGWVDLATLTIHPAILTLSGAVFCFVVYILSRKFFAGAYARADRVSEKLLDRMQEEVDRERRQ